MSSSMYQGPSEGEYDRLLVEHANLISLVRIAYRKILRDEDFGYCLWCDPGGHGDHQTTCPAYRFLEGNRF